VYDNAKEAGCPVCLQQGPGAARKESGSPEEAARKGRLLLLVGLLVLVAGGGAAYWYFSSHNAETRAQFVRDSLAYVVAGPPAPDTTTFAKADDLSPIRNARALHRTLNALIRNNRTTLLGFAEGPVDTSAADGAAQRRARQYAQFAARWHAALDAATAGGADFRYEPGVQYSLQMERVSNYLGGAVSVLRDAVPRDRVKPRATRSDDLRTASGYLATAGTELTNLPR
jgi:hypothetical protein